jgi:hypothetical protein
MSRTLIPFTAADISSLARSLREQLNHADHAPGHVEMLNMLARAVGHRNFQSLRAQHPAAAPAAAEEPVDAAQVERLARYFDAQGRLIRWPGKASHRPPCLWVLWARIPSATAFTEDDLNRRLRNHHLFGDHALLRRELCDQGLLMRTADGRQYRRMERKPSPEGLALIRRLNGGRP